MYFEVSSAICFDLDQTRILSSGNGLSHRTFIRMVGGEGPFSLRVHSPFTKCFPNIFPTGSGKLGNIW